MACRLPTLLLALSTFCVLAAAGPPAGAQLAPGTLVATDPDNDRVLAVDPVTGVQTLIAELGLLVDPSDALVDPLTGLVYVADRSAGTGVLGGVIEVDPEDFDELDPGANQRLVTSDGELADPTGLLYEGEGSLLVSDAGAFGGVVRVDIDTGAQERVVTQAGATGIARRGGVVHFATSLGPNEIWRIVEGGEGPEAERVSAGNLFSTVGGIAVEPTGDLVVADLDGQVIRVDPDFIDTGNPGANQTLVSDDALLASPRAVEVELDGTILVADPGAAAGAGALLAVDPDTGAAEVVSSDFGGGLLTATPSGLGLARAGLRAGTLLVANTGNFQSQGRILEVDLATGAVETVAVLPFPKGVAVESETSILVCGGGGGVIGNVTRIDLSTGEQQPLSVGLPLNLAEDIARTPQGEVFVGESSAFNFPNDVGLLSVDTESGVALPFAEAVDFRVLALSFDPVTGDLFTASTDSMFDAFRVARTDAESPGSPVFLSDDPQLDETTRGVAVDGVGGLVYVSTNNEIFSVPLAGGDATSVSQGVNLSQIGGLVRDPTSGDLFASVFQGIVRVDPGDGSQDEFATDTLLTAPRGMALVTLPEPGAAATAGALAVALALTRLGRRRRGSLGSLG